MMAISVYAVACYQMMINTVKGNDFFVNTYCITVLKTDCPYPVILYPLLYVLQICYF